MFLFGMVNISMGIGMKLCKPTIGYPVEGTIAHLVTAFLVTSVMLMIYFVFTHLSEEYKKYMGVHQGIPTVAVSDDDASIKSSARNLVGLIKKSNPVYQKEFVKHGKSEGLF